MNEHRGIWRGRGVNNWHYGDLIHAESEYNHNPIIVEDGVRYDVYPSTLGECSCIPDMNGKPIFEGDICTVATPNIADDEYGVVKYDENEAVFVIDFGTYTINFCNNINGSAVEIIGNIHDNSELLERE